MKIHLTLLFLLLIIPVFAFGQGYKTDVITFHPQESSEFYRGGDHQVYDINNDGIDELIFLHEGQFIFYQLNEFGDLGPLTNLGGSCEEYVFGGLDFCETESWRFGDFNGDLITDLSFKTLDQYCIAIMDANMNVSTYDCGNTDFWGDIVDVQIADINSDGKSVAFYLDDNGLSYISWTDDGNVQANQAYSNQGLEPKFTLADVNNDGFMDVFFNTTNTGAIRLFLGTNEGGIYFDQNIELNAQGVSKVHAADIDNDGDQDFLYSNSSTDFIIRENIDGSYETEHIISGQGELKLLVDMNGDGLIDVLCGSPNSIVHNLGGFEFEVPNEVENLWTDFPFEEITIWDFENDGDLDILHFNNPPSSAELMRFGVDLIKSNSHGCTDASACNYNSSSTTDNGTCCYGICGCLNPEASNYSPEATCPTECLYHSEVQVLLDINQNQMPDEEDLALEGVRIEFNDLNDSLYYFFTDPEGKVKFNSPAGFIEVYATGGPGSILPSVFSANYQSLSNTSIRYENSHTFLFQDLNFECALTSHHNSFSSEGENTCNLYFRGYDPDGSFISTMIFKHRLFDEVQFDGDVIVQPNRMTFPSLFLPNAETQIHQFKLGVNPEEDGFPIHLRRLEIEEFAFEDQKDILLKNVTESSTGSALVTTSMDIGQTSIFGLDHKNFILKFENPSSEAIQNLTFIDTLTTNIDKASFNIILASQMPDSISYNYETGVIRCDWDSLNLSPNDPNSMNDELHFAYFLKRANVGDDACTMTQNLSILSNGELIHSSEHLSDCKYYDTKEDDTYAEAMEAVCNGDTAILYSNNPLVQLINVNNFPTIDESIDPWQPYHRLDLEVWNNQIDVSGMNTIEPQWIQDEFINLFMPELMTGNINYTDSTLACGCQYPQLQWYLNGEIIEGTTGVDFIPSEIGTYSYIVSHPVSGCVYYSEDFVLSVLSVADQETELISVFPNPAKNIITINNTLEMEQLEIYNSYGQSVLAFDMKGFDGQLDISSFSPGVYFGRIDEKAQFKFIKE